MIIHILKISSFRIASRISCSTKQMTQSFIKLIADSVSNSELTFQKVFHYAMVAYQIIIQSTKLDTPGYVNSIIKYWMHN